MAYQDTLPHAFPYRIEVPHHLGKRIIEFLMDFDEDYTPNGSSFALTSDSLHSGTWYLWLSAISYGIIEKSKFFHEINKKPTGFIR